MYVYVCVCVRFNNKLALLLWPFAAEYAKLPFIPPYLQIGYQYQLAYGANFASAGAGALVETFPGFVCNSLM